LKPTLNTGVLKIPATLLAATLLNGGILAAAPLSLQETDEVIRIEHAATPILTYHKAEVPPPPGEMELYRRSGFIHPLHAPNGDAVTSIHAPDHLHHLGLWHAWVKTKWNGREIDFWNLKAGEGTVRFVGVIDRVESGESVGFTVRQQQVALASDAAPETVVLEEVFQIIASRRAAVNIIDYVVTQTNVTEHPLELPTHRYGGGIAYRAPDVWGEDKDAYVTSTGLDRTKGHATRGDWVMMHGPTENGEATVVIMGHPQNHDAPQRMRIWPEGKVFFNYAPIQEHAWQINPGDRITLRYRLLVFDATVDPAVIRPHWDRYAAE